MHGIIFHELKKYADARFGDGTWKTLLQASGLGPKTYLVTDDYPDAEVVALVSKASDVTGKPVQELLEDFGEFIVPDLLSIYGGLVDRRWDMMDFLVNTESVIHRAVRLNNPGARPPTLKFERRGTDQVVLTYGSERKMCGIAKGILRGVASYYGKTITMSESSCMNNGAPNCTISVRTQ